MIQRKHLAAGAAMLMTVSVVGCRGSDSADTDGGTATTAKSDDSMADDTATTMAETEDSMADDTATTEAGAMEEVACPDSTPGLTADTITLGGTYPFSGPAAAYSSIPKGVDTWFQYLNETDGGFVLKDGTTLKIEFNTLDDQYDPNKAQENAKKLVENDKVFAVFNPLGTPNNTAIRQYMNDQKVPQLLVATGASKWGKEHDQYPWTIGYQPDYESEGIAYATYILEQNPDAKIGVLYQNDDFGADYLLGLKEGLGDKASQIVSEITYEVTDTTVDNQVSQIKDSGADAYVVFATPKFALQAIQRAAALGWEPPVKVVTSVSASVGQVLGPAGDAGNGWVTSAYVKDPTDPATESDPAVQQYRELLGKYADGADPNDAFHLYGMSVAQTLEHIIEDIDGPLCRESLMAKVDNFSWDEPPLLVEGINLETGPGDAFPIQRIQLKQFDAAGQTFKAVGEIIDTASAG